MIRFHTYSKTVLVATLQKMNPFVNLVQQKDLWFQQTKP